MTKYFIGEGIQLGLKSELGSGATHGGGVTEPPFGLFIAIDTGEVYENTGSAWVKKTGSGSLHLPGTLQVDGAGQLTGALKFGGPIGSNNASVPVPTAGAAAGTTPPAPVLGAGANDTAGSATFGTGTTPGAGDQVTLTFGTPYPAAPLAVIVVPTNAATAAKVPYVHWDANGLTVGLQVAPAASQAATVYAFTYLVISA